MRKIGIKTETSVRAGCDVPGSYKYTCYDISCDDYTGIVTATCQKRDGSWQNTSIDANFANCDGYLTYPDYCG